MDQEQVFTGGFPSCAQYPHDVLIYTSEESSFAIFIHTASLMMRFFFLYSQKVLVLVILFLLSFGITFYMLIDENVSI